MTKLTSIAAVVLALGTASVALGQNTYVSPERNAQNRMNENAYAQAGAGGRGGAGGGETQREDSRKDRSIFQKNSRQGTTPALDPARHIFEQDCTKPFDPLGKGNLRCI